MDIKEHLRNPNFYFVLGPLVTGLAMLTQAAVVLPRAATTWKDQRAYTRLFALGIDAYYIVQNLKYLQAHDYARFSGETGNISMDENQRLHRELLWAQFKNGKPVFLDLTILPLKADADGKQS